MGKLSLSDGLCLSYYLLTFSRMLVLSDKILHKVGVHSSPVDFVFARVVTVGGRVLKLLITSRSRSFVAGSHLSPRCVYFLFGFRTCLHVWRSWFLSENSAFIPSPFPPFSQTFLTSFLRCDYSFILVFLRRFND